MIEYDPKAHEAEEICSRCSRPLGRSSSAVVICTPPRNYRSSHVDLCIRCTIALWRWIDELRPDALEPDFVVEAVGAGDEYDALVYHPRSPAAREWVACTIPPGNHMHLYGGFSVALGERDAAFLAGVDWAIRRDGLRIVDGE